MAQFKRPRERLKKSKRNREGNIKEGREAWERARKGIVLEKIVRETYPIRTTKRIKTEDC